MSASRTRVLKRVTEILNLCVPGTYTATLSPRVKSRNASAIEDAVDEAGLMIMKAIAERPNEFRYQFLADSDPITTSGDAMPAHLGPPARVAITLYSGGPVRDGVRRDFRKIQSYRENPQHIYSVVDHDTVGTNPTRPSPLAGYYDVWDDLFFFTGYSAVLSLATPPVRADALTKIPEIMENCWIRLGVGETAKLGLGGYELPIIRLYGERGMADLEEFKTGKRVFAEVDDPMPQSAVHTLAN